MFLVLVYRAWIEQKNFKRMWRELEWKRTYETIEKVLRSEKELFAKSESGEELHEMLLEMFNAKDR
jgi:hypothetical protein